MNQSTRTSYWLQLFPWLLSSIVSGLAIYVWGHSFDWSRQALSAYQFFPLLGLLAFSIMWSHYMVGFIRRMILGGQPFSAYFRYTGYVVLACLVLHPGILIYQRFRDGYGLPPHSYIRYVAPGMGWLTLLGSASLLAFLAFELHRLYGRTSWWKYVIAAGDAAMLAIFYHGLRLGNQLQTGWFRSVWFFYGGTLLIVIVHKYLAWLVDTVTSRKAVVS